MRLIVPDRFSVYSGVETINRRLLPALARNGVPVAWAVPDHRMAGFRADPEGGAVRVENAFWPPWHWRRMADVLARRISPAGGIGSLAQRWMQRSYRLRLECLARRHRATHALSTWILSDDFPGLSLPHSAFFLDRNWANAPGEGRGNKAAALDARVRTWARGAHRMLAISKCAAAELCELAPEHAGNVVCVPLAATTPLIAPVPVAAHTTAGRTREAVFYCPATANPHKNHRTLFAAAVLLAEQRLPFRIVLSGFNTPALIGSGTLSEQQTEEARQCYIRHRALLAGRIEARGYGTLLEVEANYRDSDCVVLPSEYEGFGLPLVEALRRQRPVLASAIAPFREQVEFYRAGETVEEFSPTSAPELAAVMRGVIEGRGPAAGALAAVASRVANRTWDDVARACIAALAEDLPGAVSGAKRSSFI